MQKIIIDTNVIISSLIQKGYPYRIIFDLFIEDKISLCISPPLMAEYYAVLERPKFAQYQEFTAKARIVLANIETKAIRYNPRMTLNLVSDIVRLRLTTLDDSGVRHCFFPPLFPKVGQMAFNRTLLV